MARLELFARTEVGCVRKRNEDNFLVVNLATRERGLFPGNRVHALNPAGTLVAVCDGMGGAAAGDVASAMAVDRLHRTAVECTPFHDMAHAKQSLLAAVTAANQAILDYAAQDPLRHGMGTTMTAALLFGPELLVVHVGDSRAYLRRGRTLTQLTTDHSIVGQLLAAGRITAEQARNFEQRNVLLQALGVQPRVAPELVTTTLRAGDVLMMCSDGLTGPLRDNMILDMMLKHEDPLRCCRALTESACAAGGPDNITVAMLRLTGEGLEVPRGREAVKINREQASA